MISAVLYGNRYSVLPPPLALAGSRFRLNQSRPSLGRWKATVGAALLSCRASWGLGADGVAAPRHLRRAIQGISMCLRNASSDCRSTASLATGHSGAKVFKFYLSARLLAGSEYRRNVGQEAAARTGRLMRAAKSVQPVKPSAHRRESIGRFFDFLHAASINLSILSRSPGHRPAEYPDGRAASARWRAG